MWFRVPGKLSPMELPMAISAKARPSPKSAKTAGQAAAKAAAIYAGISKSIWAEACGLEASKVANAAAAAGKAAEQSAAAGKAAEKSESDDNEQSAGKAAEQSAKEAGKAAEQSDDDWGDWTRFL